MRVIFRFDDFVVDSFITDMSISNGCLFIESDLIKTGFVVTDPDIDDTVIQHCDIDDWCGFYHERY